FPSAADHHHLHSFPTRRSSDLAINAQQADLLHLYQQAASGQRMVTPADDPLGAAQAVNLSQSQSLNERYAANRDVLKMNLGNEEDRKSTRLNSSHVKISYAVFC